MPQTKAQRGAAGRKASVTRKSEVPHRQCSAHIDSHRLFEDIRGSPIEGAKTSG